MRRQFRVNGEPHSVPTAGTFAKLERTWTAGDVVELRLPMRLRIVRGFKDSVSIERGPVVFSYPIGEGWVKLRDRGMTADWQVYPSTPWNYALAVEESDMPSVELEEAPVRNGVFSLSRAPVAMQVPARKLISWQAVDGVAEPVPQSPVSSTEPLETITLVPYAAAKLRITAFPLLSSDSRKL